MKFDEVLIKLGEFGTYQRRLYFLICLPSINAGIFMVISVFLLGTPNHRCAIPELPNDTYTIQHPQHQILVNRYIPASSEDNLIYDPCNVFPSNVSLFDNESRPINVSAVACEKWVYDDSIFDSTFVSKKDLVCDQSFLPSIAKVIFFAGVFVGAFVFGNLSDIIGRKKTLMISFIVEILSSTLLAWADSFPVFVILRFLVGAGNAGIFMTGFVIGMELVGPSKRLWAGIVVEYFFALGLVILAGVGYLLRDWKNIEIAVSFVNILYLSYYWLLPESPRWLLAQGRVEEAEAILRHAAEVNKVTLPEKIFDLSEQQNTSPKGTLWHLFSTKLMAVRTLVIFFNWMVVSMVYYGLSLNTGNLGGDFYVNFTISGLVEFPAYTLCIILLDRVGRKWLHFICMVVGGVACVCTVFTTLYASKDLQVITVVLAMVGKLGAAAAFAIIYVYSAELYPTVVRNAGMGASSCCARIGGMLAPYIADLSKIIHGDFGQALPLVIFGAASVAAGIMTLLLPETLHKDLPETIEDAINFDRLTGESKATEIYVEKNDHMTDLIPQQTVEKNEMQFVSERL